MTPAFKLFIVLVLIIISALVSGFTVFTIMNQKMNDELDMIHNQINQLNTTLKQQKEDKQSNEV